MVLEATALGAALLAGLGVGFWSDRSEIAATETGMRRFEPQMSVDRRESLYAGWGRAVERSREWSDD